MNLIVSKEWTFQASHQNPYHDGHCHRLHGHTYRVRVFARGHAQTDGVLRGMVVDFAHMTDVWLGLRDAYLDHEHLNDTLAQFLGDEPTTVENIAAWLLTEFNESLPEVFKVRVQEGDNAYAEASL